MSMADSAVLNAGERLALQCAVVKGGLPLTVTWSFNGQIIAPMTSSSSSNGGMTSSSVRLVNEFTATLTIESLTGQHGGWYVCRAANQGGRAESAVHVIVQGTTSAATRHLCANDRRLFCAPCSFRLLFQLEFACRVSKKSLRNRLADDDYTGN
jgi:hypothetical protein